MACRPLVVRRMTHCTKDSDCGGAPATRLEVRRCKTRDPERSEAPHWGSWYLFKNRQLGPWEPQTTT
jgi:hypothetical protein